MICDVSKNRFLLIHVYPAVLLVLSAGYGTSVLNVKTNFHEGRWITGCALAMIPVIAVWLLACHFAPAEFHDAITAFAIILLASILLCVIFIPKLYTIINRNRYYEKVWFFSTDRFIFHQRTDYERYNLNDFLYEMFIGVILIISEFWLRRGNFISFSLGFDSIFVSKWSNARIEASCSQSFSSYTY